MGLDSPNKLFAWKSSPHSSQIILSLFYIASILQSNVHSIFVAVLGWNASLFSSLPHFFFFWNGRGQRAPHFPTTQGPLPRLAPKPCVFQGGKAMFCASWSVLLYHAPGFMHGPSFLQMNFGELREIANFTSLGSLMATVDKTISSKRYFTSWVQPSLQMAIPSSNSSLIFLSSDGVIFSQRFCVLGGKISL